MHDEGRQTLRITSWWIAKLSAPLPAAIVALLVMNSTHDLGRLLFGCAAAWAAGAMVCAWFLQFWDGVTRRFDILSLSKMLTIASIVGAFVGLVAASILADPLKSSLAFAAALLGSLQGAAAVWFIVGPELTPPPAWQNDPETENERDDDDSQNPPTPTP